MNLVNDEGLIRGGGLFGNKHPYYPVYKEQEYGRIITWNGIDAGIDIDLDVATQWMMGMTVADHEKAKANLCPIGRVEGFRVRGMPGITLAFEIAVRQHDERDDKPAFLDVFMGNVQLRGSKDAWTVAWDRAYNVKYPSMSRSVPDLPLVVEEEGPSMIAPEYDDPAGEAEKILRFITAHFDLIAQQPEEEQDSAYRAFIAQYGPSTKT
jgi:hypothetical protein